MPPGRFLVVVEIQGFQAGMIVLGRTAEDVSELACAIEFLCHHGFFAVGGCFGHHVRESGTFHGFKQLIAFFFVHGGRNGAEHVFAGLEALDCVAHMVGCRGEKGYGFDFGVAAQCLQRFV